MFRMLSIAVVLVSLTVPSAAAAAGSVGTDANGNVTYTGDGTNNVVAVNTAPIGPGNVIFEETSISEATDTANICGDIGNSVVCNVDPADLITANGGGGADEITASGPLPVRLNGDTGDDELRGAAGADTFSGGPGADESYGNTGNDFYNQDSDNGDLADLGPGRDVFLVHQAEGTGDTYRGGSGLDALAYFGLVPAATVRVNLQTGTFVIPAVAPFPTVSSVLSGIEDAGSYPAVSTNDVLIGSASSNLLAGGYGSDQIRGGGGTDTLLGDDSLLYIGIYGAVPYPTEASNSGSDTIDSRDGFSDFVDCGAAADTALIDQFEGVDVENCETVRSASVNAFGLTPPATPPSDTTAPKCRRSRLGRKKRRAFLRRGFSFRFNCDEEARVEVFAAVTAKRRNGKVVFSKAGDVLLAQKVFGFRAGRRTLRFRVAKSLRKSLAKRFKVRLRIDVTDRAGNRRTSRASFRVR